MEELFLFQKIVNWSMLYQGINIDTAFQDLLYAKLGFKLERGEKAEIQIMIDGELFSAYLVKENFNRDNYPSHKDLLQIRYSKESKIAGKMREIFSQTYKTSIEFEENRKDKKQKLIIPNDDQEYANFYTTPNEGVLLMDYISSDEYHSEEKDIQQYDEKEIEDLMDNDSYITEKIGTRKIRHMSRAVGNSLKLLYGYRCQICGEYIGEKYGSHLIHAHHIEYFTKSLNNNPDNIMILCPNHHGIIHDMEPIFDRQKLEYIYPNGYVEKIQIDKHLKTI